MGDIGLCCSALPGRQKTHKCAGDQMITLIICANDRDTFKNGLPLLLCVMITRFGLNARYSSVYVWHFQ